MDETDRQIIEQLEHNSRISNVELARFLGISEGAVRKRIENLVERKVIQKFTINSTYGVKGVVLLQCSLKVPTKVVVDVLRSAGASRILEVSGEHDIVCDLDAERLEDLNDMIESVRAMDGVERAQLLTVLKKN